MLRVRGPAVSAADKHWLVCDMDDGVLRREPTRKAALRWWMRLQDAPRVLERHTYGPGSYDYTVGYSAEDNAGSVAIIRADVAEYAGWDLGQTPLYPSADEPFEPVDRPAKQDESEGPA